ncbi:glucose-6-phosphate dehydrogenase [Ancylobacter pratisalsi]|uniref:Glucose-6-phosphate 1-dehydrogenase n=1 Tax=Ancylobacter pratisalsi TaxID=1745854 RepID=A0A6P1YMD2_9HYPH|nr:glucose-6-phosphate dehydrogenase [Ancylobacter pratisalsi]QIB34120.1 glucose-6-phosphate dehydrogenase [Ancylobacter pratisalsi]
MTSRLIPVAPFVLTVFGATGDLARRKLLPALFHRDLDGQIPDEAVIIGVSRRPLSDEEFRNFARQALVDHVPEAELEGPELDRFLGRLSYIAANADADPGWPELAHRVSSLPSHVPVYYLATAPHLFGPICERLGKFGLAENGRVVIEKPIGKDLASALALNEQVGKIFTEDQVYRIDHYLGKETVQNLMALRFANALFEPLWNNAHIDHVQITVAEALGVEERAGYYDTAGAMRDMVQNHMLQLLCLVAMEPPASLEADAVRDEKLKVLRALKPIDDHNMAAVTVRGQYRAGASAGGAVPGYLDELGSSHSETETFVAVKAEVENWRWAGVPFYLRTGKRLASRVSEIVVGFRPVPHSVFGEGVGAIEQNRLVIRLQPDEGVKLWLMIKDPGPGGIRLTHVPLDMSFAKAFKVRNPDAYERLLLDVVRGNQTLFMRRDEVEAAWRWVDPILNAWRHTKEAPRPYTAGTWGPSAAIALIERDGRTWLEDGA